MNKLQKNIFMLHQKAKADFAHIFQLMLAFLRHAPFKNSCLSALNAFTGLAYSVPALLFALVYKMIQSGETSRLLSIAGTEISISRDLLVVLIFMFAFAVYVTRFVVSRALIRQVDKWQLDLTNQMIASLDQSRNISLRRPIIEANEKNFFAWIVRTVSSASHIGLIFIFGLHSLSLLLLAFAILVYLNATAAMILLVSAILFAPFYRKALHNIGQSRSLAIRQMPDARAHLRERIDQIMMTPASYDNVDPIDETALPTLTATNRQYASLLWLRLLVSSHSIIMIGLFFAFVIKTGSGDFSALMLVGLIAFVAVSSASNLINFLGNVIRNIENIRMLSQQLFPEKKTVEPNCFIAVSDGHQTIPLTNGDRILIKGKRPKSKLAYLNFSQYIFPGEHLPPFQSTVSYTDDHSSGKPALRLIEHSELNNLTKTDLCESVLFIFFDEEPSEIGNKMQLAVGASGAVSILN